MFHSRVERLQRVNAEPFRLERDSHGPERYGWVLSRTPSLCHRRGELCSLPRVLRSACYAYSRKSVASPRQSPRLSHSEVARAMEQGLIEALVTCLTTEKFRAAQPKGPVAHHDSVAQFSQVQRPAECSAKTSSNLTMMLA